jgi:hypothetical protein
MEPLSTRRHSCSALMPTQLLGQAIHNLFGGTDTDFRPTPEAQAPLSALSSSAPPQAPETTPTTSQASASHSLTKEKTS